MSIKHGVAMVFGSLFATAAIMAGCSVDSASDTEGDEGSDNAGAIVANTTTGYDIFLLAGQSNMAGRGHLSSTDPEPVSPYNKYIKMWDHANRKMVQAQNPIIHQEPLRTGTMGMGMTFANAYIARLREVSGFPNRKVLLVGAAWGGTGFQAGDTHNWTQTGDLENGAINRANAAIAAALAAEPTSRFQGILWNQGENDIIANDIGNTPAYRAKLAQLMADFRSKIKVNGVAVSNAVVIIGVPTPCFMNACANAPESTSANSLSRNSYLTMANGIQNVIPRSGCVGNNNLTWNLGTDGIHYDRAAQRALGQRYFAKFLDLVHGVVQTACSSS